MTIDPDGATPIYMQVAAIIKARIESGQLLPNRPVPSVVQLTQEFGIARGTAIKAVDVLRADGIVKTVPGRGTYVVDRGSGETE